MKIKTESNRVVVTLDKPANQIFVYPKGEIQVKQDRIGRVYLKFIKGGGKENAKSNWRRRAERK